MRNVKLLIIIVLINNFFFLSAQKKFNLELAPGFSLTPPLPLTISREGEEKMQLWAHYRTKSFTLPIYYSIRAGLSGPEKGWEVELNHHKIYLKNTPDNIERFSVSHGYNHLLINRTMKLNRFSQRIGAGVVIAHPECIIDGVQLNETLGMFGDGYYLAGVAAVYGIYKSFDINRFLYISLTSFCTGAWARVKVPSGHADVPMIALHFQVAPGIKIPFKKE